MFINRGNHETKEMNRTYGFEGEAKHKHGEQTYKVQILLANSTRTELMPRLVALCALIYRQYATFFSSAY